jgi:hypothetical protein
LVKLPLSSGDCGTQWVQVVLLFSEQLEKSGHQEWIEQRSLHGTGVISVLSCWRTVQRASKINCPQCFLVCIPLRSSVKRQRKCATVIRNLLSSSVSIYLNSMWRMRPWTLVDVLNLAWKIALVNLFLNENTKEVRQVEKKDAYLKNTSKSYLISSKNRFFFPW